MDPTKFKLGKAPRKHDDRTLKLGNYLDDSILPSPPVTSNWQGNIRSWGIMLNDSLGDCTCAAAGHMLMLWSNNAGDEFVPTDDQILSVYEAVGSYKPNDPSTDNGAVELDVLNYWHKTGIAGHVIGGYASVNPTNTRHVQQAITLFGSLYIGLQLPASAQNQQPWHNTDGPDSEAGSWGGHAVPIVAYDEDGLTCITWGTPQKMTWGFFSRYCDEAYAVLSNDWFGGKDCAPSGFNLAALTSDLEALGGRVSSSEAKPPAESVKAPVGKPQSMDDPEASM